MWKVKQLELWWQLYVTWLPVQDLENFKTLDFCWTVGTTSTWTNVVTLRVEAVCFSETLELTKLSSVNPQKGDDSLQQPPRNPEILHHIRVSFYRMPCKISSQTPTQTRIALFIMCVYTPLLCIMRPVCYLLSASDTKCSASCFPVGCVHGALKCLFRLSCLPCFAHQTSQELRSRFLWSFILISFMKNLASHFNFNLG
jgi:hypothetical protein